METDGKCIICKTAKIAVVKRGLCSNCYQKERKKFIANSCKSYDGKVLSDPTIVKYETEGEVEFIQNYKTDVKLIHHPCAFRLNGVTYVPDFYDPARNVFIEVSSTRQAFHKNKEKYDLFVDMFPLLKFETRHSNGDLLCKNGNRYLWPVKTA